MTPSFAVLRPVLALALGLSATAQQASDPGSPTEVPAERSEDTTAAATPGTTLVTATRSTRRALDTPWSADVVDAREVQREGYRTLPQLLRNTPGVMVQETSHGQGSPYLRGFTGYRNLLLVDGVRLNNSVFRNGPNQYWNTVDAWSIERLEVVMGPSSVLYGSDAVGGTVNALTKDPWALVGTRGYGGRFLYRGSTAEHSNIGRLEAGVTLGANTVLAAGATGKRFGDVEGGDEVGRQPDTGYDEWDADLKLEHWLSPDYRVVVMHQAVRQNDVPRTHRTVNGIDWEGLTRGSDRQRDLDQARRLTYVQLHGEELGGVVDTVHLGLSFQEQDEKRDRIRSSGARQLQGFEVNTLGAFATFESATSIGRLSYGAELYHDEVSSFSSSNPIQGPVADDASYDLFGLFVQDEVSVNERLTVTVGTRFNYAAADAGSVSDPVTSNRISVDDDWTKVVGSARFRYWLAPDELSLFGGVSQGFRAPNLSDLTRFDSQRTNEFEIPAPGLDPESFLSYELGVKLEDGPDTLQTSVFYTDITDAIALFPTGNVNGAGEFEITKDNIGDGWVAGVELDGTRAVADGWSVFGVGTWLDGEVDTFPTSAQVKTREPLDRLMPLTLIGGVRWEPTTDTWLEASATWADKADRLSSRDKADTSRIPSGGTPSYFVVGVRGSHRVNEHLEVFLGLENLTDEDYRIHGSGVNRPGRAAVLGLTAGL